MTLTVIISFRTEFLLQSSRKNIFFNIRKTNESYDIKICGIKSYTALLGDIIIYFILTPFLSLPSKPLLHSPHKLQNFTTPNEPLMSACVDLASLSHT